MGIPWWQSVLVHALVGAVGADPEPAVFAVLDGLDKELADLVGRRALVALLRQHDGPQLLFVPVRRRLRLLLLLLLFFVVTGVRVQTALRRLAVNVQVVGKLALLALVTVALLEEDAQHRLRVDAKRNLLDLHRLVQQQVRLALGVLGRLLLTLTRQLLGLLALLLGVAAALQLRRQLRNLSLGLGTLLVLHAKGAILDLLGRTRLLAAGRLLGFLRGHFGCVVEIRTKKRVTRKI